MSQIPCKDSHLALGHKMKNKGFQTLSGNEIKKLIYFGAKILKSMNSRGVFNKFMENVYHEKTIHGFLKDIFFQDKFIL